MTKFMKQRVSWIEQHWKGHPSNLIRKRKLSVINCLKPKHIPPDTIYDMQVVSCGFSPSRHAVVLTKCYKPSRHQHILWASKILTHARRASQQTCLWWCPRPAQASTWLQLCWCWGLMQKKMTVSCIDTQPLQQLRSQTTAVWNVRWKWKRNPALNFCCMHWYDDLLQDYYFWWKLWTNAWSLTYWKNCLENLHNNDSA